LWKGVACFATAAIAPDAQQACNRTTPAAMKKRATTRPIVAKSTLYTVGYHGIPDAAVQHAPRAKIVSNKNRQKKFLLKLIFV
jgi:hypothetical protein